MLLVHPNAVVEYSIVKKMEIRKPIHQHEQYTLILLIQHYNTLIAVVGYSIINKTETII